jgi:hypothetical protein
MAVRAVEQVPSPALVDAGNVGQLVAQSGGYQDPAGTQLRSAGESDMEARFDVDHGVVEQAAAIAGHLCPAGHEQVAWGHAIPGQKAVHMRGRRVAWPPRVHHRYRAPGPCQHQGRAQAGRAATNHHDVVFLHGPPD